jgi:hypothetical protein
MLQAINVRQRPQWDDVAEMFNTTAALLAAPVSDGVWPARAAAGCLCVREEVTGRAFANEKGRGSVATL